VAAGAVDRLQVRQGLTIRGWWLRAAKIAVSLIVLALIARSLARNWSAFRSVEVSLAPHIGWIALSAITVFVTYALQIESWRRVLAGWGQRLSFRDAARAWCLSNLGRYLPGKVWSVAGLVVLAERAGVRRSAAAVSAFAMQAIVLGTGVVLIAVATPHAAKPVLLIGSVLVAVAIIGLLAWRRSGIWLGSLARSREPLPPLPASSILPASILMLTSWATYGMSFWMLARGLLSTSALSVPAAMGLFALGYLLGVVAIFAPGGIMVRELALVGFLTPLIGSGGAVALSLASRVLLTLTEVGAAGLTLLWTPADKEKISERPS
jgi:hypothetical protein